MIFAAMWMTGIVSETEKAKNIPANKKWNEITVIKLHGKLSEKIKKQFSIEQQKHTSRSIVGAALNGS